MGSGRSRPSKNDRRRSRARGSRRSCDHSNHISQCQRYPTRQPCERSRRQPLRECCCNTVNPSASQYPQQQCQCQQHAQSPCCPDILKMLPQYSNVSEMSPSNTVCCCTAQGNESECDFVDVVQCNGDDGCKTVVCLTFNQPRKRRNY